MTRETSSFEDSAFLLRAIACSGGYVTLWYGVERGKCAGFMKKAPVPGTLADIHALPMRNGGALPRIDADTYKAYGAVIGACASLLHIKALQAALHLIDISQAEGDPSILIYQALQAFCEGLVSVEDHVADTAIYAYPVFEALLLEASGYALSPENCAKYPEEAAIYISPKSGAGVGITAGEPYKHKLLPMPASFRAALLQWHHMSSLVLPACEDDEACLTASALTEHFLTREFGVGRFEAREAFIGALMRKAVAV